MTPDPTSVSPAARAEDFAVACFAYGEYATRENKAAVIAARARIDAAIARLTAALTFYADPKTWKHPYDGVSLPPSDHDLGDRAPLTPTEPPR